MFCVVPAFFVRKRPSLPKRLIIFWASRTVSHSLPFFSKKTLQTNVTSTTGISSQEAKKAKVEDDVEEELVLSDWDLSDLEPEWNADEAEYPLLGLHPFGFLAEDQRKGDAPKSFSLGPDQVCSRLPFLSLFCAEKTAPFI